MALPNFICVGAEKAGTTPLFRLLSQHRNVYMPPMKETHFFTQEFDRKTLAFYESFWFKGHRGQKAIGESTPEYMRFPEVPGRLRDSLGPDLKLIFCLRDPVKRAFSQYHLHCRLLEEDQSFARAIDLEPERVKSGGYLGQRRAYLGGSRYLAQIKRFLPYFPRENMFFMLLEQDFVAARKKLTKSICDFLEIGVDPKVRLAVKDSSNVAPRVLIADEARPVFAEDRQGRRRKLPIGTIAFRTGRAFSDSLLIAPSPAARTHFTKLKANLTAKLDPTLAAELFERHFRAERDALAEFLGRDLSSWGRYEPS